MSRPCRRTESLTAFCDEHRRCGQLETGKEVGYVQVTCDGCGGAITVPLRSQPLTSRERVDDETLAGCPDHRILLRPGHRHFGVRRVRVALVVERHACRVACAGGRRVGCARRPLQTVARVWRSWIGRSRHGGNRTTFSKERGWRRAGPERCFAPTSRKTA